MFFMVGVCSYLLIGFWFHRLSATKSAQKAMLVNRVSDTLLIFGRILQWWYLGGLDYGIMMTNTTVAYYNDWICFTLLLGAMGKSAQLGLHVWLADAMEGKSYWHQCVFLALCFLFVIHQNLCATPLFVEEDLKFLHFMHVTNAESFKAHMPKTDQCAVRCIIG